MKLYPYQEAGIEGALSAPGRRWMFNDEMGLGKTAQAITVLKRAKLEHILIVCPAIVRSNWLKELDLWWPEHPEAAAILWGHGNASLTKLQTKLREVAYQAPIQIVSYNLLDQVNQTGWDAIIFDEAHRLKSFASKWTRIAREMVQNGTKKAVLSMTATPMADQPLDACNIAEVIWPNRFGGLNKAGKDLNFKCKKRYAEADHNGYGWSFKGINLVHADELKHRLSTWSSRTTKLEVAHLLPAFTLQYWTLPPMDLEIYKSFGSREADRYFLATGLEKIPHAVKWLEDVEQQATHCAILTHFRKTAKALTKMLGVNRNVYLITGEQSPEQRNELLAKAKADERAIIVATMHSIGIGIDLTFCTAALFAELYYRPETIIQALGRFSRLSGKVPSSCTILALEGTYDEVIATNLASKMDAINKGFDAGLSESELASELNKGWNLEDLFDKALDNISECKYYANIELLEEDEDGRAED